MKKYTLYYIVISNWLKVFRYKNFVKSLLPNRYNLATGNLHLAIYLIIIYNTSCTDVFVPDIKTEIVELIAPSDGFRTDQTNIFFKWLEVDDADGYDLRVSALSLSGSNVWNLDTITTNTELSLTLEEGSYQWRVIAFNEAFESDSIQVYQFTIGEDTTMNLGNYSIDLNSPLNESCVNTTSLTFDWDSVAIADNYIFQIGNEDFTSITATTEVTTSSTPYTLSADDTYYWRVRAESLTSNTFTLWTQNSFTLDTNAPDIPILNSPFNNDTIHIASNSSDLIWNSNADAVLDSIYIYTDAGGTQLLEKQISTSSTLNLDTTLVKNNLPDDFYWEVRSVDKAGNVSEKSGLWHFYAE